MEENKIKNLGIIPARMASTRFPGKPLVNIDGKPMIQRVYEQCKKSTMLDHIVIATDSQAIADVAKSFSAEAVLTSESHPTGMDRILETIESYPEYTHIVNIQGDEPCISPTSIDGVLSVLHKNPDCGISTAAVAFDKKKDWLDPHQVKVVFDFNFRALYFSRSPIPYEGFKIQIEDHQTAANSASPETLPYKHLGLYAYTKETLEKIPKCKASNLETSERLEQLRFLQNGIPIYVYISSEDSIGVDVPEDVNKVLEVIRQR